MIEIVSRGFSSIQDAGRIGFRQKGIPYAGVMDQDAYELLNNALGNVAGSPVIEYTKMGLSVKAARQCQCLIVGQVNNITVNGLAKKSGQMISLDQGDVLDTGKVTGGTFAYLGFVGKYEGENVLNSASESKNILEHEMLHFLFTPTHIFPSYTSFSPKLKPSQPTVLDCFPGPEFGKLLAVAKEKLTTDIFHLSRETWRMAFKLQEKLPNKLQAIASGPVIPGTVQLTPVGEITILMRDAQTTGGYPRILQLSDHSINKICRVGWGGEVKFHVYL